jgi:hypothetical protein
MIRGDNDPIYRRYGLRLAELDNTYVFKGNRNEAGDDKVSDVSAKIFISYAREDEVKVMELYKRLKKGGFQPWMDQEDIVGGEEWQPTISKAIDTTDLFVFCITKHSVDKRGEIQREILKALEKAQTRMSDDIYIIPLLLEDVSIPERLSKYQAIKYFEQNGWNRLTQSVQTAIKRLEEDTD